MTKDPGEGLHQEEESDMKKEKIYEDTNANGNSKL
jgi:hypothetical protein